MQIRGKILTIAGIVLIFGYFITDSLKAPYDPTQVVMVGNDTLGRDWGAMAAQAAKDKLQQDAPASDGLATESDGNGKVATINSEKEEDPFTRKKFNQDNYSTIQSPDGREIITGYNRPEEQTAEDDETSDRRYRTRHQRETQEPEMKYRD